MNGIRQRIAEHVSLASFELNSVAAELDCEQDRAVALKNHLQLQADKRVRRMTISSILAGAFATAFVSALTLSDARQPAHSSQPLLPRNYWRKSALEEGKTETSHEKSDDCLELCPYLDRNGLQQYPPKRR
jgi:hypothetical protein